MTPRRFRWMRSVEAAIRRCASPCQGQSHRQRAASPRLKRSSFLDLPVASPVNALPEMMLPRQPLRSVPDWHRLPHKSALFLVACLLLTKMRRRSKTPKQSDFRFPPCWSDTGKTLEEKRARTFQLRQCRLTVAKLRRTN